MTKKIIISSNAPKAIGPYSQAVKVGNTLYLSGQIPLDPTTGEVVGENIEEQTNQCFRNIKAILKEADYDLGNVVVCEVFLQDISEFSIMNKVYEEIFKPFSKNTGYPARAAFQVSALPKGVKIQIKATAVKV